MVSTAPDGIYPTSDVAAGTVYNLTDTVYVEARMVDNEGAFMTTVSLQKVLVFFFQQRYVNIFQLYNCYASKTDNYDDDYELIGSDGLETILRFKV